MRGGTGVLVHSLITTDTPNLSLSLIQTTFLVRSRQRLSHTDQTWQHKDPNEGELKPSGRKHFISNRRKIQMKRLESTFQVPDCPKELRYNFYPTVASWRWKRN